MLRKTVLYLHKHFHIVPTIITHVVCSLQGCFRHLSKIFKQLEEFRPFELLRSSRDRIHYLLVKEAKVIAMTCTHAALKRKDLVELAFKVSKMTECSIWLYNKQIFHYNITRVYKCVCVCVWGDLC